MCIRSVNRSSWVSNCAADILIQHHKTTRHSFVTTKLSIRKASIKGINRRPVITQRVTHRLKIRRRKKKTAFLRNNFSCLIVFCSPCRRESQKHNVLGSLPNVMRTKFLLNNLIQSGPAAVGANCLRTATGCSL